MVPSLDQRPRTIPTQTAASRARTRPAAGSRRTQNPPTQKHRL